MSDWIKDLLVSEPIDWGTDLGYKDLSPDDLLKPLKEQVKQQNFAYNTTSSGFAYNTTSSVYSNKIYYYNGPTMRITKFQEVPKETPKEDIGEDVTNDMEI